MIQGKQERTRAQSTSTFGRVNDVHKYIATRINAKETVYCVYCFGAHRVPSGPCSVGRLFETYTCSSYRECSRG